MKRTISSAVTLAVLTSTLLGQSAFGSSTPISDPESSRYENIRLAVEAIDGTTLHYNELFSFNEIVGPRTSSRGYVNAPNGRGAEVTGGGVAQVASVIYLALRESGADISYRDRYTYGSRYKGDYVSDSGDAILVDYASDIDFSFICGEASLTIDLTLNDDELLCSIAVNGDSKTSDALPMFTFSGFTPSAGNVIASGSADLSDADQATRKNVELAAASIDGTVLLPGERFSFNKIVGPRTEKYGFASAPNGRGVNVTGGGVARAASAVWKAVENCDSVTVTERSTYGKKFTQHYVSSSNDAILIDYNGSIDFAFRNTGNREITIHVFTQQDSVFCEITE